MHGRNRESRRQEGFVWGFHWDAGMRLASCPYSIAGIHWRQAVKQRKLLRGHKWKLGDLKLRGSWGMQEQVQFWIKSAQAWDVIHETWAAESCHWRAPLCLWSDLLADGHKATCVTSTLSRWPLATRTTPMACTEAERGIRSQGSGSLPIISLCKSLP